MDKKFNFGVYIPKAYRELATEEEKGGRAQFFRVGNQL